MSRSLFERVAGLFSRVTEEGQPLHEGFIRVCSQCGHRWYARKKARPKRCPNTKCQSRKWDRTPEANHEPPTAGGPALTLPSAADLDAAAALDDARAATTTTPRKAD